MGHIPHSGYMFARSIREKALGQGLRGTRHIASSQ